MVQTPTKPVTLAEFLELPETKPASEYVDGAVIQKPMPQGKHSILQRDLCFALTVAFKPTRLAQAIPELRCTFGDRSIVPDIVVFQESKIPRDANGEVSNTFDLAPDWTIFFQKRYANEILSPGQSSTKVTQNILHCLAHGTVMGWLIDPEEQLILVYDEQRSVQVFEASETVLPVPEFAAGLALTLGEVFGWLTA
ncbi:Uma2 family endonuclease [filamentous cyanobacterium LEGE 11480]|uniref:Uma2 family endonuclease n=1 Tax=Romeriopsis navalis LEGE 11480 TaxID=2777977 RepID=A0A928Z4R6_9CYAN|nr:Uma2 family endonuclease [Romeriopsis navalis]MBE9030485.1 Uma2 family endonuclease [Romeriopsis navalis LEGE 11480]